MKQTKIFYNANFGQLEQQINKWLVSQPSIFITNWELTTVKEGLTLMIIMDK